MNQYAFILLKIAGYLQMILCLGSLLIPGMLHWKTELRKLPKIIAQIFWTYAGYILVINLFFGLISVFGAAALLDKSFLAKSLSVFIFFYWLTRIMIQFFYFDTKSAPQGFKYRLGEIALVSLFVFLTVVYGMVSFYNFK